MSTKRKIHNCVQCTCSSFVISFTIFILFETYISLLSTCTYIVMHVTTFEITISTGNAINKYSYVFNRQNRDSYSGLWSPRMEIGEE